MPAPPRAALYPRRLRSPVVKFEECANAVQRIPAATPAEISELAHCCAVFMPADPSRAGSVAFWRPDGGVPPVVASGAAEELTVVLPGDRGVELVTVPAVLLPVRAALPVLTRTRGAAQAHRATSFWGAAAVLALQLAARGLLLPGLTAGDHDAWRAGPLRADDLERVRELAAAMPPDAHAVPVDGAEPLRLPDPERLLRAFLDAVADALPRSPPRRSPREVRPSRRGSRSTSRSSAPGPPTSPRGTTRAYVSRCASRSRGWRRSWRTRRGCRSAGCCRCTA